MSAPTPELDYLAAGERLRELLLGGAAIPQPLVNRLSAMGLVPKVSYGLSEMGSQVCTGQPTGAGVVGLPLPGREVCIRQGEICVRGETLFAGYFKDGALALPLDQDGWFHTRDKGHLTTGGELVVEGRLDNLFISGGENIQPETVRLSVAADGQYFWNGTPIDDSALEANLQTEAAKDPQPDLHIRGDKAVRYERVAQAMAAAQRAGVRKIGFVTEPQP